MKMPEFESVEQMAGLTAGRLAEAAAGMAFKLFREKEFRKLAQMDSLSQEEQDRIFNELVLAFLILIMLMFEAPDLRVDSDLRRYARDLNKLIPNAYIKQLKELGVEARFLADWEKLITMRYEEYARDRHDARAAAMELKSAEKKLDTDDLAGIQLVLPVQTVGIGCHRHICRGKTDGRDELFKALLRSLSRFYVEIRVPLEGGRITPLARLRVAITRFFRRLLSQS